MKNNMKYFTFVVLVGIICVFSYAQEIVKLSFSNGSLFFKVDPNSGKFGMINTAQTNNNINSLLFDPGIPSSYFIIYVDNVPYQLSQLTPIYPLGLAVGSQIDGIYQINDNIQVEIAYFAMDTLTNFDTVGIALRITNMSKFKSPNIAVKILLDTDISESVNKSLLYLPNGSYVTNGLILNDQLVPQYLFFGEKFDFAQEPQGQGMYVYPSISTNKAQSVVIANWRRIIETDWIPSQINSSLQYNNDSLIDIGVGIYFSTSNLAPESYYDIGTAISLSKNTVLPILDDKAINQGVFNTDRFEIVEIIANNMPPAQFTLPANNNSDLQGISSNPMEQLRQQYRQKKLGLSSEENNNCMDTLNYPSRLLRNDQVWKYLFELNFKMDFVEEKIDEAIQK